MHMLSILLRSGPGQSVTLKELLKRIVVGTPVEPAARALNRRLQRKNWRNRKENLNGTGYVIPNIGGLLVV